MGRVRRNPSLGGDPCRGALKEEQLGIEIQARRVSIKEEYEITFNNDAVRGHRGALDSTRGLERDHERKKK